MSAASKKNGSGRRAPARPDMQARFWIKATLAVVTAAVFALTLAWRDWIEIVFRVEPDQGSGWLELLILGVALSLTLAFSISARGDRRRRPLADASR